MTYAGFDYANKGLFGIKIKFIFIRRLKKYVDVESDKFVSSGLSAFEEGDVGLFLGRLSEHCGIQNER
ncbi:hypothetical protein Metme_0269 [Methylomonas methanica MC09]|uniref:Uncharacterized protein n=1 Tax=Methylomonas methanica (strain DSM 25384 / MC09) TaxID=857087 RepID=F9ZZQ9_METMM|nr:hypothetical protein Metme_0269 [Methylomonas methanica MC09]